MHTGGVQTAIVLIPRRPRANSGAQAPFLRFAGSLSEVRVSVNPRAWWKMIAAACICSYEHFHMHLNQLRRTVRWAEKIAIAQRQLADELAAALIEIEKAPDPLGEHILDARRRYRFAEMHSTKSGKSVERELQRSYVAAMNLGFPGSYALWFTVMRSGTPDASLPQAESPQSPNAPESGA